MRLGDARRRRHRSGAVLLEVLVALAILATAGAAAVTFAVDVGRTVARVRESEADVRRASAFLDAVALWPREDLDRHLGSRLQGRWRMRVDRPVPTLYVVLLTDTLGTREVLRTALYRPEPIRPEATVAAP
jgi:type II secretory pathway pseudopilin PulG